jgi:hypothetical protein
MTLAIETEVGGDQQTAPGEPVKLHYVRGDATHLTLDGKIGNDPDKTLLMSRGFHWISEESYNR